MFFQDLFDMLKILESDSNRVTLSTDKSPGFDFEKFN